MTSQAGPVAGQPHPSALGKRGDPCTPLGRQALVTGDGPARRAGRPVRRHPRERL